MRWLKLKLDKTMKYIHTYQTALKHCRLRVMRDGNSYTKVATSWRGSYELITKGVTDCI